MAIKNHLAVTILVDGEPATEYDDTSSSGQPNEPNTTTKYIEVTSGSRFAFKIEVLPAYQPAEEHGLSFYPWIDGNTITATYYPKASIDPVTGFSYIKDSAIVGSGTEMKKLMFSFKDLETRDTCEEDIATLKEKYSQLGCLHVAVYRMRVSGWVEQPLQNYSERDEDIPEKALKGRAIAVAAKQVVLFT